MRVRTSLVVVAVLLMVRTVIRGAGILHSAGVVPRAVMLHAKTRFHRCDALQGEREDKHDSEQDPKHGSIVLGLCKLFQYRTLRAMVPMAVLHQVLDRVRHGLHFRDPPP